MSTKQRTPAPWHMDTCLHIYGTAPREATAQEKAMCASGVVEHPHVCTAKSYADAAMIAAAPDMLGALEAADKWVAMYLDLPGHDAAARSMLAVIRKATSKAKGETP